MGRNPYLLRMNESELRAWNAALAEELRSERARHRELTLDVLAGQTGMPKVTLERYLNDKRPIPAWALAAFCRAFDVPVAKMLQQAEDTLSRADGAERSRSG